MKILIFILSIAVSLPPLAFGSRSVEPGHGDIDSRACAHNQTKIENVESRRLQELKKELAAVESEQKKSQSKLDKLDCSVCDENVRGALKKIAPNHVNQHIDHLSGGNGCNQGTASNVEIYNSWAEFNNWTKINEGFDNKRNIAAENTDKGDVVSDECVSGRAGIAAPIVIKGDPNDQLAGGGGGATVTNERCKEAPSLTCGYDIPGSELDAGRVCGEGYKSDKSTKIKCLRCIQRGSTSGTSSFGRCLREKDRLVRLLVDLEDKAVSLAVDIEDEEINGSPDDKRFADRKGGKFIKKAAPTLIGLGGAILTGLAFDKFVVKKQYDKDLARFAAVDERNARRGYVTNRNDLPKRNIWASVGVGLLGGFLSADLAYKTGHFGCAEDSLLGRLLGGGKSGGIGGALSGIVGSAGIQDLIKGAVNKNGGSGSNSRGGGALTGQGTFPGAGGSATDLQRDLEQRVRDEQARRDQFDRERGESDARLAQLSEYYAQVNSQNALYEKYLADSRTIGTPNLPSGVSSGSSSRGTSIRGGLSGVAQSILGLGNSGQLSGGLNVRANIGVGARSNTPWIRGSNNNQGYRVGNLNQGFNGNTLSNPNFRGGSFNRQSGGLRNQFPNQNFNRGSGNNTGGRGQFTTPGSFRIN